MMAWPAWLVLMLLASPEAAPPVDFDTQVVPILTRYGCNQGSCHGAAIGRGGFKLSLYGGDPSIDFQSIARDLNGRRVNLKDASRSLLLRKPTGDLDHEGDFRFDEDSEAAAILRRWVQEGARRLRSRKLEHVEFSPVQSVVSGVGDRVTLRAVAHFDNGVTEDVTRWTTWTATDAASVEIDEEAATARVLRRGRHIILARYLNAVSPIEIVLPWQPNLGPAAAAPRRPIDRFVQRRIDQLGLTAARTCDDYTFLRRLSLSLRGRLPQPDEIEAFLADGDEHKRQKLIEEWLNDDSFVNYWSYQLASWWRVRPPGRGQGRDVEAADAFVEWIRSSLRDDVGLNVMARELVTATGDTHEVGQATFYRLADGPREQAEYFSEVLMGVRLRCANCHNHPLDHWTQDDYHGLAALFAGIQRGRVVSDSGKGEVIHPRTAAPAVPKIPGGPFVDSARDRRTQLAEWLTRDDNPYFATAFVNRTWSALMGRGLVEPVDDLRPTNPPTHPELLQWLTGEFRAHDYSLRWLVREVVTSDAYQRAKTGGSAGSQADRFYTRAVVRPLSAEVLADAIADVTQVPLPIQGVASGTRAVELTDVGIPSRALDVLGRCDRETSCESAAPKVSGLARTLHLLNGPLINAVVSDQRCWLQQRLQAGCDDEALLEATYVRVLGRPPSDTERKHWLDTIARDAKTRDAAARRLVWEDLWWALLCSREFTTNH